jgi:hypothetical protein
VVSEKRLALTPNGNIRYQLKTAYRGGTTHVIFEQGGLPQLDFIAKLAALVPRQRVNLTRFHGLLARGGLPPNSKFRVRVTPAKRGRVRKQRHPSDEHWLDKTPVERHAAMTWMQRLKRVFNWAASGSILKPVSAVPGKIIACIEEPAVIERILAHLHDKAPSTGTDMLP